MHLTTTRRGRTNLGRRRSADTGTASDVGEAVGARGRPRIGRIVAASMSAGLLAAVALAAAPFVPADEEGVTGATLLGCALGWALVAALSVRSAEPQRWALAPALFLGASGVVVLVAPAAFVHGLLAWVWPPVLIVVVGWTLAQARRELPGGPDGG